MSRLFIIIVHLLILTTSLSSCAQKTDPSLYTSVSDSTSIQKSDAEWLKSLGNEKYHILRQKGTEPAFSGKLLHNKSKGVYTCAGCGSELFTDEMKYESHCGWPSFDSEIAGGKIQKTTDHSHGMTRTEITCARCGGHLGHIFDDGPTATGQRYCVNSLSLDFIPSTPNDHNVSDTITLGGGCFWCTEAIYEGLDGILSVESGYAGGTVPNPSYDEVSQGNTGHAEVVQIIYQPSKVSLEEIFKVFFETHDPTTLHRQGADVGTQYRSAIFYRNISQKNIAKSLIEDLNKEVYDGKIVTEVVTYRGFYPAEKYHQNYYSNNKTQPYCQAVIQPKLEKFQKIFHDRLKK